MDSGNVLMCLFEHDEDGYEEPLPTHIFDIDGQCMPCTGYGGVLCYEALIQHERWRALEQKLSHKIECMRKSVWVCMRTFHH